MRSVKVALALAIAISCASACGSADQGVAAWMAVDRVDPTTTASPAPTTVAPTTTLAPATTLAPDPDNDRVLDDAESAALRELLAAKQAANEPGGADAFGLYNTGGVAQLDMVDFICSWLSNDYPYNGIISAITAEGWSKEGTKIYVAELGAVTCADLMPSAP